MKIRNVNVAIFILVGLVLISLGFYVRAQNSSDGETNVLLDSDQDGLTDQEEKLYGTDPQKNDTDGDGYSDGAEVKAGYDPKKPAPGDKIIAESSASNDGQAAGIENNNPGENLTEQVAQKISEMTNDPEASQDISLDDIKLTVEDLMSSTQQEEIALPDVTREDIKIKKQSFKGMSADEKLQKKKDDLVQYLVAIYYILSSNSPSPITSASSVATAFSSIATQITSAVTLGDSSSLNNLTQNSQKVLDQMKAIEVPEDLVDLHIKAMRYALYSQQLKTNIDRSTDDPLKDIAKLSKVQAFIGSLLEFSTEAEEKMNAYGVSYEEALKELKKNGIDTPLGIISTNTEEEN